MNTQFTFFKCRIKTYQFNGNATTVECFGFIKQEGEFQEETIISLIKLGNHLRPICSRMLASGEYVFNDGILVKVDPINQKYAC